MMASSKADTRDRLIHAAQEELILGSGDLEMLAVAKRAQLSVGLAYHHFGSKAGLIAAVVERFYHQLEAAAFDGFSAPSESWAKRERARIAAYIQFHYSHPFAPLIIGALSRSPEVRDVEAAFMRKQLAGGSRMISAAQADGILSMHFDPSLTIALMSGGIRQAVIVALQRQQRPDPEELTEKVWVFMTSALRLGDA